MRIGKLVLIAPFARTDKLDLYDWEEDPDRSLRWGKNFKGEWAIWFTRWQPQRRDWIVSIQSKFPFVKMRVKEWGPWPREE
jgi:hypothetical protein